MIPESSLIKNEILVRQMQMSSEVLLTKKSLVRYLALSLGLIYPKETRKLLLDVLEVLFEAHIKNEQLSTKEIIRRLGEQKIVNQDKAIYYHLLKLKELKLLNRKKGRYFFGDVTSNTSAFPLKEIFKTHIQKQVDEAFESISVAFEKLESSYK